MESATILRAASILGLSSSLWLSGIYFGSSQLTVPILYRFPAAISADIFDEFYHRGLVTVVPLSVVSGVSYGTAAYLNEDKRVVYAAAGVLALAALPWTILLMKKTIDTLLSISKDEKVRAKFGQDGTVALLKQWRWMNMVRAGLTLAGGMVGCLALAGQV